VLGDGDQCSGGEELELNKAVDPGSINWSGRSMGQPCVGCIGRRNAKKREISETGDSEGSNDGRDDEIELLFDGDAPERSDETEQPSVTGDEEIGGKQKEIWKGVRRERQRGKQRTEPDGEKDCQKIERPDAQDSSQEEEADVDRSGGLTLAEKKLGDEIRAQHEEEQKTDAAHRKQHLEMMAFRSVGIVAEKHHQKRRETKDVEFGTIESRSLRRQER